jgi:hypothetical protein
MEARLPPNKFRDLEVHLVQESRKSERPVTRPLPAGLKGLRVEFAS